MNNSQRIVFILFAAVLCGVVLAQAPVEQKPPLDPPRIDFAAVDLDSNGRISKEESVAVADLESVFDRLDTNQDKWVSPVEFSLWPRAGKTGLPPRDPATVPGGSAGAQHMPSTN